MMIKGNILLIEREHGEFDEVEFSFRYVNLDERQCSHIQKSIPDVEKPICELENSTYVLSVPLDETIDSHLFKNINSELDLDDSNFGVFISFTSGYDHSGFTLPKHVKEFYLNVGGQFDCSIINI